VKKILIDEAKDWLIRPFTLKETMMALFQMNPEKAPGPDGFNASFYQRNWDILGMSIYEAVSSFISGKLLKEVNHTFLTLVPKVFDSFNLVDFRPISCCNVLCKLISKLLSNRLQAVITELIFPNQSAFIKGSQISDCSLLAHELIRDIRKKQSPKGCCLKIDLHKTFDSVNRDFVVANMKRMGFPYK